MFDVFFKQGSRDNMSIVLVTFPAAPKPSIEAQKKEAELETAIERRIKGSLNFSYSHSIFSLCCCFNPRRRVRVRVRKNNN